MKAHTGQGQNASYQAAQAPDVHGWAPGVAKNDFRRAQGGGLDVFLEMAVYPMRCVSSQLPNPAIYICCVLTMADVCEYDVEAFFVDRWIA